jgi:hypothetical protein
MTPKEKAYELVTKFCITSYRPNVVKKAKLYALIAVEFAKENPLNTDGYNKYLQEVKQEIEKL